MWSVKVFLIPWFYRWSHSLCMGFFHNHLLYAVALPLSFLYHCNVDIFSATSLGLGLYLLIMLPSQVWRSEIIKWEGCCFFIWLWWCFDQRKIPLAEVLLQGTCYIAAGDRSRTGYILGLRGKLWVEECVLLTSQDSFHSQANVLVKLLQTGSLCQNV